MQKKVALIWEGCIEWRIFAPNTAERVLRNGLPIIIVSGQVLQYVSTTYSFTNVKVLEERSYPADVDWRAMIRIAETEDQHTLNALSHKYVPYTVWIRRSFFLTCLTPSNWLKTLARVGAICIPQLYLNDKNCRDIMNRPTFSTLEKQA